MIQYNTDQDFFKFTNKKLYHFSVDNLFSPDECAEIIELAQKSNDLIRSDNDYDYFVNYSVQSFVIDQHQTLPQLSKINELWQEAADHFEFEISHIEKYHVKCYEKNDFIADHHDQYLGLKYPYERKISMILNLSNRTDYEGGDLKMVRRHVCEQKQGSIMFFPSFFLHEVSPILSGTRFSLVSWAWGPYWR